MDELAHPYQFEGGSSLEESLDSSVNNSQMKMINLKKVDSDSRRRHLDEESSYSETEQFSIDKNFRGNKR